MTEWVTLFFSFFSHKYRRNPIACREFKWNTFQRREHFLFRSSGVGVRSEVVVDDSVQPLQGGESRQPSAPRTWEAPSLGQATWDCPFQGGLVVLGVFTGHRPLGSTGQHSLWVSLPGQGQPEFSRSRTILGNICTRGTTNTFVFFQHSLLCLSQTPPFLQQKAQPCEECSTGLWEVFALSKWGLALGICEIISRKIFSLRPTNGLYKIMWEQPWRGAIPEGASDGLIACPSLAEGPPADILFMILLTNLSGY